MKVDVEEAFAAMDDGPSAKEAKAELQHEVRVAEFKAAIARLVAMPDVEYAIDRKPEAKRLGVTVAKLDKLVRAARNGTGNGLEAELQSGPYLASAKGLVFLKPEGSQPLANFWPRITRHLRRDDGLEAAHEYEIECHQGDEMILVSTPVSQFTSMAWVAERLPPRYILCAGSAVKDRVREAAQRLSDHVPECTTYTAPGWREFGGQCGYVHGGGVIGVDLDVRVEFPDDLAPFTLPAAPTGEELIKAVRAAFDLLHFGPPQLAGPLFCVPWRAVVQSVDFSIWMYGRHSAFKTERAVLIMQHLGPGFTSKRLYASWHTDSASALREKLFLMKDAPALVDDYRPSPDRIERARQQQMIDSIVRAAGNRAGRATMTSDLKLRSGRAPRCLLVSTAEELPSGESTKGRTLLLEVRPGDFLAETLTRHQRAAAQGQFAGVTSAFIAWLAARRGSVLERWDGEFIKWRSKAATQGQTRAPGIVADLFMAAGLFCEFAIEKNAISESEAELSRTMIWKGLIETSEEQAVLQLSDKPEVRFVELIQSSLASGGSHFADRDGNQPNEPASWGWRKFPLVDLREYERGSEEDRAQQDKELWRPMGSRIGWVDLDRKEAYLDPDASYKAANAMATDGNTIAVSVTILAKRMDEVGLLVRTEKKSGLKRKSLRWRETLQGVQRGVLVVKVATLQPEIEDE